MSYTDRYIVETYSGLFEGLSSLSKIEKTTKDSKFYKSFGAFSSEKSADKIIADIKSSRKFRNQILM